jgi:hypothetical protein
VRDFRSGAYTKGRSFAQRALRHRPLVASPLPPPPAASAPVAPEKPPVLPGDRRINAIAEYFYRKRERDGHW